MTPSSPPQLKRLIRQTMLVHRHSLRQLLAQWETDQSKAMARRLELKTVPGRIDDSELERLQKRLSGIAARIEESVGLAQKRSKIPLHLKYDGELPICNKKEEIAGAIRDNQVVVICGETGSGKSTQLPKICLELGRGITGMIGHTQPRRIAARSVAARIAEELKTPLSQTVGYKIRFTDETSPNTLVKVMTDGILLAESQNDPWLNQYDTIIIDEAHERSLNIDFLLGIIKRLLAKRPELKLIITSATIDSARFANHFGQGGKPAPVIEVSGRSWPINIVYRSPDEWCDSASDANDPTDKDDDQYEKALLDSVDELARRERGDILIFMPTERDIFETAKLLKHHAIPGDDHSRKTEILPLYARLPGAQQQKIFHKSSWRKIVIATNVAESSLTVPGIRYVIDTGTARISRYSVRSRTQRLPIEPVSQASADQRAGRCGRTGPGVCIRLYSREDYLARDRYTTPEIRRTNLASVILQTMTLQLGAIEKFPFIDPPSSASINEGYKTLYELGAIDSDNKLNPLGKQLARWPVDPRIARMIIAAEEENVLRELLIIASALEIQDPRERPFDQQEKADLAHLPFADETSDFLSYLKLWDFWHHLKETLSGSQLRKACRTNFLSFNRMKEWSDIHLQLMQMVREGGIALHPRRMDDEFRDAVARSILTGLLYGIAQKSDSVEYQTTGQSKFFLWPGSGLFKKRYSWIIAAERVETTKKYLRTLAKIDPDWIEKMAGHILVTQYRESHWSRETGYVHAYEKVSLYGLTIVPRRRINYGPINPAESRTIFIQEALVEREFDCRLDFFVINGERLEEARRLQAKWRRHQLLLPSSSIHAFYDQRIPDHVFDSATLKKWYLGLPKDEKSNLCFSLSDLCSEPVDDQTAKQFPDDLETSQGVKLAIEYQFTPGEEEDGLSLIVPRQALASLAVNDLGWLVPGLLEQKVIALLKSLPKEIRRNLVPVPESAKAIVQKISYGNGNVLESVARQASQLAGRLITPRDFDASRLPNELVFGLKVLDDTGTVIARGKNPEEIRSQLGVKALQTITVKAPSQWQRDSLLDWDFGSLPEYINLGSKEREYKAWPAVCDPRFLETDNSSDNNKLSTLHTPLSLPRNGVGVSLRLFDAPAAALFHNRLGVIRLFCLQNEKDLRTQAKWIPDFSKWTVYTKSIHQFSLENACCELIARLALDADSFAGPRCEGDYRKLVSLGKSRIGSATVEITRWTAQFAMSFQEARLILEKNRRGKNESAVIDASRQLESLLATGFHLTTPWQWLKEYPRFLRGIVNRFDKINAGGLAIDGENATVINHYWQQYLDRKKQHDDAGIHDENLSLFRWMIEELRISYFAQKLGTSIKISPNRLDKQWEKTVE